MESRINCREGSKERWEMTASEARALLQRATKLQQRYMSARSPEEARYLVEAIRLFESCLPVFDPEEFPVEYGVTLMNFGLAYTDLPGDQHQQNLQRGIDCYRKALLTITESYHPELWAATQSDMRLAYSDLWLGNREQSLQSAISCFENALRLRTEQTSPDQGRRSKIASEPLTDT
jgi:tetratricopeptide (TPR) repeat protein